MRGVWSLPRLQVETRARPHQYAIRIGRGILSEVGRVVRECLGDQAQRIALISNKRVFSLYGVDVMQRLKSTGFAVWPWLINDGERHKSLRTVENVLRMLSDAELQRSDGVIALGGGVVGDVAGFAAAIYL